MRNTLSFSRPSLVAAGLVAAGLLSAACASSAEPEGVAGQGITQSAESPPKLTNRECAALSDDLKKTAETFVARGSIALEWADCGDRYRFCNGPPSSQVLVVCPPLGPAHYGECKVGLTAGSLWSFNLTSVVLSPPDVASFLACIGQDV